MGIKNKLGQWMRDRLGVTEAKLSMEHKLQYINAYLQLVTPERIEFSQEVKEYVLRKAEADFGVSDFELDVHKNDLMFHHQLVRKPDASAEALFNYYKVGLLAAQKITGLLPEDAELRRILDFGSGYGRCSRFYPHYFPGAQIVVSEVKENALRFQQDVFGFKPLLHGSDPQDFDESDFDLIIAISVFTHLPEQLSRAWLKVLYRHLAAGGHLIFTYVDIGHQPGQKGDYHFTTHSEDAGISWVADRITDDQVYGSAFYSKDRITKLVEEELGVKPQLHTGISGKQDGVVIRK